MSWSPSSSLSPSSESLPDRRSPRAIDLDGFIPAALNNLSQKLASGYSAIYRPQFGVGMTDWRVMALLAAEPWIAPVRICEATGLDKAAVSRSLRDLVEAGLVEVHSGEPHQRRLPVALTRKGLEVHDRMVGITLERQERLLADFSPEERAQLRDFIVRMWREADAMKDGD